MHEGFAMVFANRNQAADQLAEALAAYQGQNPLILAIPRGAVPMGQRLARALEGELDVVLVRKLRAPFNPEFAIGSIDESGWTYIAAYA
jgi:putative phosphoribosyl transferase